jgi:hypothetical protein
MNRTLKNLLILLFFAILWTCKPISYQDLVRNQSIREKTIVLTGGQQDSRGKSRYPQNEFVREFNLHQRSKMHLITFLALVFTKTTKVLKLPQIYLILGKVSLKR